MVFITPFNMVISGPSQAGKSSFVRNLIKDRERLLHPYVERVIYVSKYGREVADEAIEWLSEMPPISEELCNSLLVIDDATYDCNQDVGHLFVRHSHHWNISVVYIVQNLFERRNPLLRTLSLNSHYTVFFKNPRDQSQIGYLARQMNPLHAKNIMKICEKIFGSTSRYVVFDFHQATPNCMRIKANLFGENGVNHPLVYKYDEGDASDFIRHLTCQLTGGYGSSQYKNPTCKGREKKEKG